MKTLTLSLKKKWFDLIKTGIKKEEYREIKPRYLGMFCQQKIIHGPNKYNDFDVGFHLPFPENQEYDKLEFTLAYPSRAETDKWLTFKNPKIRIGTGKPEWGAELGRLYFVITWDDA